MDKSRYLLIDKTLVTEELLSETEITVPRIVKFAGDAVEYSLLKWKSGAKPEEIWGEFPVYSDEEIINILLDDINTPTLNEIINGTSD